MKPSKEIFFFFFNEGYGKDWIVLEQDSKKITFSGFICIVLFKLFLCQRIRSIASIIIGEKKSFCPGILLDNLHNS